MNEEPIKPMDQTPDAMSDKLKALAEKHRVEIEALQARVGKMQHRLWRPARNFEFDAKITGYNPTSGSPYAWQEMFPSGNGFSVFTSGLHAGVSDAGAAREQNGARFVGSGTIVRMRANQDLTDVKMVFDVGGSGGGGFFPVLVVANGFDGGGLPKYDLYRLPDTGHVTKLNLSGALSPAWSVPRTFPTAAVTAATTNSIGMAYTGTSGAIALYFVIESGC